MTVTHIQRALFNFSREIVLKPVVRNRRLVRQNRTSICIIINIIHAGGAGNPSAIFAVNRYYHRLSDFTLILSISISKRLA